MTEASGQGLLDDASLLERLRSTPQLFERLRGMQGSELSIQQKLRREFADELVRAALLLEELRRRARSKFSRADSMWFDRAGLEQATSEVVSRHKAARFRDAASPVLDLCCGIGGDAIALADGAAVIAVDRKPGACLATRWNAEVYGVADRIETRAEDVTAVPVEGRLLHIDPDRRPQGRRSVRIEDHVPGLEFLQQLTAHPAGGAIKLSPASNFGGKFPGCEIELVSVDGECKEAVVWFGGLRSEADWRATVLPTGATLSGDPWEARAAQTGLGRYFYDPDPAVVRAGLVDVLAEELQLSRLDAAEEYLTSDALVASPFVQAFEVLAELSNNEREIRAWFRQGDCRQLEVKCRRVPVVPEKVRHRLPLDGSRALVLAFARIGGRARAVVCRRL
jgi:hypothetical protein